MAKVEIYTSFFCPFCHRAKSLLDGKDVAYTDIDVMLKPGLRREMTERAGGDHRVPQIFINGQHIGGCDELFALEVAGKLDSMLLERAP